MRRMGAASIPGGAIQTGRAFSQLSTGKTLLGECPCSSLSHPAWLKLADAWCETGEAPGFMCITSKTCQAPAAENADIKSEPPFNFYKILSKW